MFWWSWFDWKLCNYLPFFFYFHLVFFLNYSCQEFFEFNLSLFKEPLFIGSLLMTEDFHTRNFVSVLQIWNSFPFIFSLYWSSSCFCFFGFFLNLLMLAHVSHIFFHFLWLFVLFISLNFLSSPSFLLLFMIFTFILFPLPLISLKCLETIYAVSKVKNSKDNSTCPLETDEWQIKRILK